MSSSIAILNSSEKKFKFYPRLFDHALRHFQHLPFDGPDKVFTHVEQRHMAVVDYRLFQHLRLGVDYTTYNMRRCHDSINPTTHPDVMALSTEHQDVQDAHRYCYARILGMYHTFFVLDGCTPQRMDFLHVRWLHQDTSGGSIWQTKRLPRVSCVPYNDTDAFGFLDPVDVIRGVHLLPRFRYGRTSSLLPPTTIGRVYREPEWHPVQEDWNWLYIGM